MATHQDEERPNNTTKYLSKEVSNVGQHVQLACNEGTSADSRVEVPTTAYEFKDEKER